MKKILSLFVLFAVLGFWAPNYVAANENDSYITFEQENAIEKAKSYIDFSGFSKSWLIEQLVFEGFSDEDSKFAVNELEIDWNEQAKRKAESYIDYSSFSKSWLIEQLKFDGFTQSEADYGVSYLWYKNDSPNTSIESKKSEMLDNKQERVENREEYKETITELRDEAKEMREERKAARQEFVAAAKENLTARIQAKGARLSQIPQDKLSNAAERIEEMIVKYEENEKLSDEIKNVILDQLYALQEMIEVEIEVEVETETE